MDILVTFLEGIITFVSPCLLPMLPLYLAYFAGGAEPDDTNKTRHTLVCALGFVLGFSLVFTLLGAFAGTAGGFLLHHQRLLNIACGLVMVVLGLNYLGIFCIPLLQRTWHPTSSVIPRNFATSLLFGVVFAIGWSPCVGTFLASALSMAASSATTASGIILLLSYSAGLGLPFVLLAVLVNQLEGAFAWVKQHYDAINKMCGALLVVLGMLMATGMLGAWLRFLVP